MKRILLYLSIVISMAVFAQPQIEDDAETVDKTEQPAAPGENNTDDPDESSDVTETSDPDFKPAEEISEDFPVLLPSDI
jgi:hypothetical protein